MIKSIECNGGKYHNETVFTHLLLTCDNLPKKCPLLRLAGLLHDIGKPDSMRNGSFNNHEIVSEDIARKELLQLRFPNDEINYICKLIRNHMRVVTSKKSARRLLSKLYKDQINYFDWFRLRIADSKANLAKTFNKKDAINLLHLLDDVSIENCPLNVKLMSIDGNDVMRTLGIKQGKHVGKILNYLFERIVNGEIENKREILIKHMKGLKNV